MSWPWGGEQQAGGVPLQDRDRNRAGEITRNLIGLVGQHPPAGDVSSGPVVGVQARLGGDRVHDPPRRPAHHQHGTGEQGQHPQPGPLRQGQHGHGQARGQGDGPPS